MQLNTYTIGSIAVVVVLLGVLGAVFLDRDDTHVAATTSGGTPQADISETVVDFGEMLVSEERGQDIVITNTGDGPLEISRVRTSCGCTVADLTMDGRTMSFNMEMHNPIGLKRWKGALKPGESATLRAVYRPFVMPVKGAVERQVYFDTNDPENKTVTIRLQAFVQ